MVLVHGYLTVEEVKDYLELTSNRVDRILEISIGSASRLIDKYTGRHFYLDEGAVRYFDRFDSQTVRIDDLVALDALAVDWLADNTYSETWEAQDYILSGPTNLPYDRITVHATTGRYLFPSTPINAIRITGDWGWTAIPDDITMATLLLTTRFWKRKDAPFGIAGSNELGQLRAITAKDPDVWEMVKPYRKMDF